ncbi:unnamed protein product [Peronospora belbahrii]|uniref:Uncharacterized protein n=1 Tax=Peronospora belbahrii TaxID=622444 RepID=A0AAU9L7R7_9STRA|nr:unnamed protein product [Peronospora belbahrii]
MVKMAPVKAFLCLALVEVLVDGASAAGAVGGGWGGYGPYCFGFLRGGLLGWAYPLGYWNTFGAGLYGGGCGLGVPFGGLYYC